LLQPTTTVQIGDRVCVRETALVFTSAAATTGVGGGAIALSESLVWSHLHSWSLPLLTLAVVIIGDLVRRCLEQGVYVSDRVVTIRGIVFVDSISRLDCVGVHWTPSGAGDRVSVRVVSGRDVVAPILRSWFKTTFVGGASGRRAYEALVALVGEVR
jgi:hypothetical protein